MRNESSRVRIGLMPVMIDLYNRLRPGVADKYDAFVKEVCGVLSDERMEVIACGVVSSDAGIREACLQFERLAVDLLVVCHVSYCQSGVILPGVLASPLPVVLWPAQPMRELVPAAYDSATVLMNHGVHGTQDLANMLRRKGRPYGVLHGHYQRPGFADALFAWAQAGRAVRAMQASNPIVLGGHFDGMLDLLMDEEDFLRRLGVRGREISAEEFVQSSRDVSAAAVQEKKDQYRSMFELAPEVTEPLLDKAARHELASRAILERYDSRAMGLNFLSLCNDGRIADGLHVAASVLMAEGIGYGGEGDWVTAMLTRGLLAVDPMASFSELFSVGYEDARLVLRHWGEGNLRLARTKPVLRASTFNDVNRAEFLVTDFEFSAGPATVVNLNVTADGGGQILTYRGVIQADSLPAVDGPRAIFTPHGSAVEDLLTEYAYAGGSHHLTLVTGDREDLLRKIARLTGWTYSTAGKEALR